MLWQFFIFLIPPLWRQSGVYTFRRQKKFHVSTLFAGKIYYIEEFIVLLMIRTIIQFCARGVS